MRVPLGKFLNQKDLSRIVEELATFGQEDLSWKVDGGSILPSRATVVEAVEELRAALYPGYFGVSELTSESVRYHIGATLDLAGRTLWEQVRRGFCFDCRRGGRECTDCYHKADEILHRFLEKLPAIQRVLSSDVQAAYDGDPAAKSKDEVIFCYPGLMAVTYQRLAHELHLLGVPMIPRIITEHAHSLTGIDIHPGAQIGESFFIDHGTGVVIGETSIIGDRVRIYQGVTLGARSFPLDEEGNPIKGIPRHPIVEDDVVIYSGATVLGRVTVGRGAVVGANVWITENVPAGSVVK
jgi:serine O-acetyltransferase